MKYRTTILAIILSSGITFLLTFAYFKNTSKVQTASDLNNKDSIKDRIATTHEKGDRNSNTIVSSNKKQSTPLKNNAENPLTKNNSAVDWNNPQATVDYILSLPIGQHQTDAIRDLAYNYFQNNPKLFIDNFAVYAALFTPDVESIIGDCIGCAIGSKKMFYNLKSDVVKLNLPEEMRKSFYNAYFARQMDYGIDQNTIDELQKLDQKYLVDVIRFNHAELVERRDSFDLSLFQNVKDKDLKAKVFRSLGAIDAESGKDFSLSVLPDEQKDGYADSYIKTLYPKDLNKALNALNTLPAGNRKDKLIFMLAGRIAIYDHETAVLWANQISNSETRNAALKNLKVIK